MVRRGEFEPTEGYAMGRKTTDAAVEEKRKPVKVRPVEAKHKGKPTEPYRLLAELIEAHHGELEPARIVLLWRKGWRADVDRVLTLARMRKASEVDRVIAAAIGDDAYDFAMMLNEDAWGGLSDTRKRLVIDHELCHAAPDLDRDGDQKVDAKGRLCWRLRKHPIQEFPEIIDRYGIDEALGINAAGQAAIEAVDRPLIDAIEKKGGEAEPVVLAAGDRVILSRDIPECGTKGDALEVASVDGAATWVRTGPTDVFALTDGDFEPEEKAHPVDPDAWKSWPINKLAVTDGVLQRMAEADVLTLGDFQKFQERHGDRWATN